MECLSHKEDMKALIQQLNSPHGHGLPAVVDDGQNGDNRLHSPVEG